MLNYLVCTRKITNLLKTAMAEWSKALFLRSEGLICRLWVRILPSAHSSSPPPPSPPTPSPKPLVSSGYLGLPRASISQNVQTLGYPWLTLGLLRTKITASVDRMVNYFCLGLKLYRVLCEVYIIGWVYFAL